MPRLLVIFLFALCSTMDAQHFGCSASGENVLTFNSPPPSFSAGLRTAKFSVTYDEFIPEAESAFQYAADIRASILISTVPVKVNVWFTTLLPGMLGIRCPTEEKIFRRRRTPPPDMPPAWPMPSPEKNSMKASMTSTCSLTARCSGILAPTEIARQVTTTL